VRRDFNWGQRGEVPAEASDRVLTAPNVITAVRLALLPVFAWLMLGPEAYGWAWAVLAVIGSTDWVDGYVARRFDQVSRLGKMLDPIVDRLFVATVVVTMLVAGMLPWWLVAVLVGRDVLLLAGALVLYRGIPDVAVTKMGKLATFVLMFGLPGILLGHVEWAAAGLFLVAGWILTLAGTGLYYIAGIQYAGATLADDGRRR
jgi:cardiolipin synthase (CMP-forming)